jgi:hypothetical protein
MAGRGTMRGRGAAAWRGAWCVAAALAGAVTLLPAPARALQLSGSLSWDAARTQMNSTSSDIVQRSFGQNYRIHASSYLVSHRYASWNGSLGWRDDRTLFSGTSQSDRRITMTDMDMGVILLPATMPMSLNFRRSLVDSHGDPAASQDTLSTTISFNTRVPMRDGNPLGVSAYQTTLDPGTGTSRSRLFSLSKRWDLGSRNRLSTGYQFSQFHSPDSRSTGHGVSVSDRTEWSKNLSTNAFANISTRSTTSTRLAGGRSLFMNNSAGGSLSYRRNRDMTANLAYSYTESPQDQSSDIKSHLLSGRTSIRLDKKTDVNGRFAVRRLDLPDTQLDTATVNVGLIHRPRFGWSTGGQVSLSKNRTQATTTTDRDTYSVSGFLNARHDMEAVRINWGGNVAYSSSQGDFSQDRLTTTAQLGATETRLRRIRINGEYRFIDIRESNGGGLDAFSREHGLRATGTVVPVRGLWLPTDVASATITGGVRWSQQFQSDRNVRTIDFTTEGRYSPFSSLTSSAALEIHDNSSDLGGADEVIRANLAWSRPLFRRGAIRATGDLRRNYSGGNFQSQESTARFTYDYSVGLLRISVSADYTTVDLGGAADGTDTNSVRVHVVRTF